jgi:hypothetical protein
MIVDIVDKYCTNDNNPIKNLRLKEWILRNKFRQAVCVVCSLSPNFRTFKEHMN